MESKSSFFKEKKLLLVLSISLLLKVVLSLSSFHPDITALNLAGFIISSGHVWDLYDYLFRLPSGHPLLQAFSLNVFTYPPLAYLFQGFFHYLWTGVLGLSFLNQFIIVTLAAFGNGLLNISMLLLKLPYIAFDLAAALCLMQLADNQREKFFLFLLWAFNPVNIYTTYMMGQFDIIPTFFVILSLLLARKGRLSWAAVALGMGVAFKVSPIFLVVPLALLGDSWFKRAKLAILSGVPYLVTIFPYLFSHGFRSTALFASQSAKSLYAQIPVSGGESILLFPAALIFLYLVMFYRGISAKFLWVNYFLVLLLFFVFTHTHPQWFLWLTPFLILDLVYSNFKHWLVAGISLISFIILLFFFDPSLTVGLLSPVWPALATSPSVWKLLGIFPDYNTFRSIFQTIFVAGAGYYLYFYLLKNDLLKKAE